MAGFHQWVVAILIESKGLSMKKINQQEIVNEAYNLILTVETKEEERQLLIEFKNDLEQGKDFERAIRKLSENLRLLAVKNITHKKTMSKNVHDYYKKISSVGLLEKEIGAGLMSYGIVR